MTTVLQTVILFYTITQCNSIGCSKPSCGPCSADGSCRLNCGFDNYQCQNAFLTCKDAEDCDIDCTGSFTGVCQESTIDASNAINVAIDCDWTDSCKTAAVTCGTGDCIITCDQQTSCQNMVVDATNTKGKLQINCWLTNSCNGIDVTCGSGTCYMNCGGSKNGQDHCTNMKLKCGTGDCRVNCDDLGYRQCVGISVDTTLAKSFTCNGDNIECASAPQPFTAAPTTIIPTIIPTITPTTIPTTQPITYQPTSVPTIISVSVSLEISIIATNVTNGTIKDTFTGIINDYLITHLEVSGDFSLSVDVMQHNKVIVTVSTKDIAAFNETQLVSYIDSQLQNTDIRIIDPNIETTKMEELMDVDDDDDEPLIIIYVLVIVIIILVIAVLIIAIIWHKKKRNGENNSDKKNFSVLECSPQSTGTGSLPMVPNTISHIKLAAISDGNTANPNIFDEGENGDDMYTEVDDIHNTPNTPQITPTLNGVKESIDTPTLNGIKES